ncbi:MAG: hypothetical protein LBR11_07460 [Deltaproteobacteria bacterium]|jgi:hypothetical protein|nr:hypothetical protein [Deltaproteobacteria bacterium]
MKVLPFNPSQSPKPAAGRRETQTISFQERLSQAGAPLNPGLKAIISENHQASREVSAEDLGAAGELVKALVGQIKAQNPQALGKIHNLDGILYYYQV